MLILGLGLGLECFGLGINNNAKRHIIWIMQYWIIVNVHWIPTLELPSSCHKRPGLLAYLFYCSCYWLEIERLDQLWHWLEKFTLAFSALALVCGLDLACLWPWPWLTGHLGLDTSGLVNISAYRYSLSRIQIWFDLHQYIRGAPTAWLERPRFKTVLQFLGIF